MIITPLLKHQRDALEFLQSNDSGALFMFLGSGKSLTALAYAEAIGAKRVLICSDKTNTVSTWPEQIYKHTDWDVDVREINQARATCVNYDYLWRRADDYGAIAWDLAILDESSEFKDQRTRRHRGLHRALSCAKRKVILNGAPATERLEDLFGQFSILDGGQSLGRTITEFRRRYMQRHPLGYGWVPQRSALTKIRKDVEHCSFWLTDTPDIVLPEQHYTHVTVEMTDEQTEIDQQLQTEFGAAMGQARIEVSTAAALFIKRLQLCGGVFRATGGTEMQRGMEEDSNIRNVQGSVSYLATTKLQVVEKVVKNNPEAKIVVWHSYIPETALLQQRCLDSFIYVGDIRALCDFSRSGRRGVLLIRNSFCKGLNQLAEADISIFYSNPLSFARRAQAEGRVRRITSTNPVTHYLDITTKGGADEIVYHQLKGKKSFALTLQQLRRLA